MFEDLIYVLTKYDAWLWQGFLLTLQLLAVSVVFGTLIAIPLSVARVSKLVWVQALCLYLCVSWDAANRAAVYDVLCLRAVDRQH